MGRTVRLPPPISSRAPYWLVIDLEATCDDAGAIPRSEREIIEIGAVLVGAESLEVEAEFECLVKPLLHPHLSDFCVQLTGIQQTEVEGAGDLPGALLALRTFIGERSVQACAWGPHDAELLGIGCGRLGLPFPFETPIFDLVGPFSLRAGLRQRPGLRLALHLAGLDQEGGSHRGIHDARAAARLLPWCLGRVPLPPASNRTFSDLSKASPVG